MWNLEKDPHLARRSPTSRSSTRPPDPERLRAPARARRRVQVPRLRQRVVPALGRLAPPEWLDDPDFDLDYHLRRSALPDARLDAPAARPRRHASSARRSTAPGRCGSSSSSRASRTAGAAMVQKMHHTITDGEGGIRMSEQFIDLAARRHRADRAGSSARPTPIDTSLVETTVDTLTHQLRRGLGIARRTAEGSLGLAARPDAARRAGRRRSSSSGSRPCARSRVGPGPLAAVDRALAAAPLRGAAGAARRRQGGGQGARRQPQRLLRGRRGRRRRRLPPQGWAQPVDELRISMPVSTRKDGSAGGNAFTPTRVLVPAGIEDPAERFAAIRERLDATKREQAIGLVSRRRRASPTCCPPRWSCASPASRSRRSTSRRRTCGARRSRSTSPAPASSATTRWARAPAPRGTSRSCPTTATSTWG